MDTPLPLTELGMRAAEDGHERADPSTPLPLTELGMRAAEDGHERADPSPAYRKAPKGRNSTSSSSSI